MFPTGGHLVFKGRKLYELNFLQRNIPLYDQTRKVKLTILSASQFVQCLACNEVPELTCRFPAYLVDYLFEGDVAN